MIMPKTSRAVSFILLQIHFDSLKMQIAIVFFSPLFIYRITLIDLSDFYISWRDDRQM